MKRDVLDEWNTAVHADKGKCAKKGALQNRKLGPRDQYALPSPVCVLDTGLMITADHANIFDNLVCEITQHYHRGRVLIAVDGADGQATGQFADSLAAAMRAGSRSVVRSTSALVAVAERHDLAFPRYDSYRTDDDYSRLRDIVARFREASLDTNTARAVTPFDAMLIVDGRFLLRPELRGLWHFGVWLEGDLNLSDESLEAQVRYTRDREPRGAAHAIFDVTKAEAPVRVWADSC